MSDRKANWFELGLDALLRRIPELPACYACPLCLKGFRSYDLEQLTLEHVPPESLGGRDLILTCYDCNHFASGKTGVDTHAKKAENAIDFATATMTQDRPAQFGIKGLTQEVRVISNAGGLLISGIPKANSPSKGQEIEQALTSSKSADQRPAKFHISLHRDLYSHRRATISWLRAGYLAAFAALGYTYILRPILHDVREQIAKPDEMILQSYSLVMPEETSDKRSIAVTTDPPWLRALAIQMGRHVVFLPWYNHDLKLYERLHENSEKSRQLSFTGNVLAPWPREPKLAMDFT